MRKFIEEQFDTGMSRNWCYINFVLFILSFIIGIGGIILLGIYGG
jgi:hypothetical protein